MKNRFKTKKLKLIHPRPTEEEVLKALEEEIERAKHQKDNGPTAARWRWDEYVKDLETKHADIQILGMFDGDE